MGFRTLVGGLYSDWLRPYIKSGLSCRDLVIDIISPEYLMSKVHRFFSLLKIDLWVIEGDEISSQKRLAIFYAGHELGKNYLTMLAFGSSYRENYIGKKWVWTVPEIVKKNGHKCSLMVIETLKSFRKMFGKTKCFYIPFWIFGETDVSRGYSSLLNKKNTSLKSDLSKIKRNNLHFELTNKPSMVHDFYYNMYIPYITKIHSNRSEMESYDFVKRELRKGGDLLFIKKEKEYIAGILLTYKNRTAKLNILGVKDGNSNYIKDGAIGALCYFSVSYSAGKGITKIDFGGSRPFLKDGTLQYKKKWNQKISDKKKVGFLIRPLLKTDVVKGFFLNNPFIYEEQMSFKGAIFVESDQSLSKKDFKKICQDFYVNGLSKLVIYRFGEADNKTWSIVPPEFSDRITINSAESIF